MRRWAGCFCCHRWRSDRLAPKWGRARQLSAHVSGIVAAAGSHPEHPADLGHLGDPEPADAFYKERLGHRKEVVEAEGTGLRHPVVDVEVHFSRDVADSPGGGSSNYDMKVL
jgi:hypothetical protein